MTTFVTRAGWGHTGPRGGHPIPGSQVDKVVFHHTPGQDPATYDRAVFEMGRILGWHRDSNGWDDIGYTWVVWDRYAFEGRGFVRSGAHAPGANSTSVGVAFLMDGRNRTPTPVEWQTARDVMTEAVRVGACRPGFTVGGHRDHVSTSCPGDLTYRHLADFHSFAPAAPPAPREEDELNATEKQQLARVAQVADSLDVAWAGWKFDDGRPVTHLAEMFHFVLLRLEQAIARVDAQPVNPPTVAEIVDELLARAKAAPPT